LLQDFGCDLFGHCARRDLVEEGKLRQVEGGDGAAKSFCQQQWVAPPLLAAVPAQSFEGVSGLWWSLSFPALDFAVKDRKQA
jgi:hypothetical protein